MTAQPPETPFFTIVTVTRNDAWSLMKTMRSVFEQSCTDVEYIVVDGASSDGSQKLVDFWQRTGLVDQFISEPDTGVYNGMNKGLRMARGRYVCFLNSSDVFADGGVLERVKARLEADGSDGLVGWGELNDHFWASWTENEALKLSGLGYCHQSLFARRELLLEHPFDERPFKTDSDSRQIARLYAHGAHIPVVPEVLAIRGGDPGISADLARTAVSIRNTLTEEYPDLTAEQIELILNFRRSCAEPAALLAFFRSTAQPISGHIARMVVDTLFLRPSKKLTPEECNALLDHALAVLDQEPGGEEDIARLIAAQRHRAGLMEGRRLASHALYRDIKVFGDSEQKRFEKLKAAGAKVGEPADIVVSLTSFPGRIKTLHFVLESLLAQTRPPKEIHLCLAQDEIINVNWLPTPLKALQERGVVFKVAPRSFRQYNKFLHNADANADRPFVILDDDTIYPPTALETLIEAHRLYPDAIVSNRCHLMPVDAQGNIAPYKQWPRETRFATPSHRLFHTGVGGVLYPPGFLNDPMVTNIDDILHCAPYADDIWLKVCAMAKGVPSFGTTLSHKTDWYLRYTPTMQASTLMSVNVERGLNDTQMQRCLAWLETRRPDWREDLMAEEAFA